MSFTYSRFFQAILPATMLLVFVSPAFSKDSTEARFLVGTRSAEELALDDSGISSTGELSPPENNQSAVEVLDPENEFSAVEYLPENNCHKFEYETILLSGQRVISASFTEEIDFRADIPEQLTILKLERPFPLTRNCTLSASDNNPTLFAARLEKSEDDRGFSIKIERIILPSGYYLEVSAESQLILFKEEKNEDRKTVDHGFCDVFKLLPVILFADDLDKNVPSADLNDFLTDAAGVSCKIILTEPSYTYRKLLEAGGSNFFYMENIQSITVPHGLVNYNTGDSEARNE